MGKTRNKQLFQSILGQLSLFLYFFKDLI
uniref:Uncharacterized protein n=1 Tax=Rhizophora mucronata TaxID=61149 RepID=A0A2P2KEZ9_RHIMU